MITKIIINPGQIRNLEVQDADCMEWLYCKGIPIEAQYLYRKAHEMAHNGHDATALKYYRQALIIAPSYVKALFEMGNSYAQLGMFREALSMYDRAIHIDPGLQEIHRQRELILANNEK